MSDDDTTLDTKGIDSLMKALKGKLPDIHVGIMGTKNARHDESGLSNADIGAFHEFGTTKIPKRSFLKEPLAEHLDKKIESSGIIDQAVIKQVIKENSFMPLAERVAIIAEAVVLEGFASNGYGKWAPWKNGYQSKTGNILVDTTQLRDSISYEIK